MPGPLLTRRDMLSLAAIAPLAPTPNRGRPIMSPAVQSTPASRRAELYGLLGDLPDRQRPIGGRSAPRPRVTATSSRPGISI